MLIIALRGVEEVTWAPRHTHTHRCTVTLSSSRPCPPFFLERGCWKDCSPPPAPKELCQVPLGCRSSPVFNQLANSLPGVCFTWSPTKSKPSSWAYRVTQPCLYLNDPQPALQVTASLGLPIRPRRLALEVGGTRLPLKELPPGKEEDKRLKWIHTSKANRRENRTFLITSVKEMKMSWPAKGGCSAAMGPRGLKPSAWREWCHGKSLLWQLLSSQWQE